jgi:pyruvate/2-oxoglutarate/acetoin dehydrogenase E1 component
MAIGAAGCGFRPIVDWRQVTFSFVAMDQIVNQAAKIHYMFGGQATFPNHVFPDRNRITAAIRQALQGRRPAAAA